MRRAVHGFWRWVLHGGGCSWRCHIHVSEVAPVKASREGIGGKKEKVAKGRIGPAATSVRNPKLSRGPPKVGGGRLISAFKK